MGNVPNVDNLASILGVGSSLFSFFFFPFEIIGLSLDTCFKAKSFGISID